VRKLQRTIIVLCIAMLVAQTIVPIVIAQERLEIIPAPGDTRTIERRAPFWVRIWGLITASTGRVTGTIYNSNTGQPYVPKPGDMTRMTLSAVNFYEYKSWPVYTSYYDSGWTFTPGAYTIKGRADVKQPDGTWKSYYSPVTRWWSDHS